MRKKQRLEAEAQAVSAWLADVSSSIDELAQTWPREKPRVLGRHSRWTERPMPRTGVDVIDLRNDD